MMGAWVEGYRGIRCAGCAGTRDIFAKGKPCSIPSIASRVKLTNAAE